MILLLSFFLSQPLPPAVVGPAPAGDPIAAQGELLYRVAGCVGCHSPPGGGAHLSGGRDNPTMFGTFYAPNISPDPETGIGTWTEEDFIRAMRHGKSPTGRIYWPTFPTMAYTQMSDEDLHALWVYLRSQPAVKSEDRAHEPRPLYSLPGLLRVWRAFEYRSGAYTPDPAQTEQWNRGAYLVKAVTYCDQCHTPRGKTGLMQDRRYMAGGANIGKYEIHPNLTPDPRYGLADWTEDDLVRFLSTGEKPDGTFTREDWVMAEKVQDSYSYLSEADKRAIAVYVKSLDPVEFDPFTHEW